MKLTTITQPFPKVIIEFDTFSEYKTFEPAIKVFEAIVNDRR